ncbi:hypothetical protein [Advenella incenata]|jgi:hypothetical protein|uniref:hypothetical protein n=1 Tax=Advenella incenata TaxID=267800 RepID=UPI000FEC777A|nr:hypothetical protein [Advenella incenata]
MKHNNAKEEKNDRDCQPGAAPKPDLFRASEAVRLYLILSVTRYHPCICTLQILAIAAQWVDSRIPPAII